MESETVVREHRLVHLDLKGAPPKLSYYEWLLPTLHKWGATGLLVEYEDMFPYEGHLQSIACSNAYSPDEVKALQSLAEQNGMIIIPLVQTFGHFEFVLKHEKFRHLREVSNCPMTLCPMHSEAVPLVTQMIDQVIRAHPGISWFHIGADEVFHVGLCEECENYMKTNNLLPVDLFLGHVRRVLEYLRSHHPDIHLIMWDDMFRGIDLQLLQGSGIGNLVQPMVWYYQTTFSLPLDLWSRYTQVFGGMWVASAFKGATGPCAMVTDIGYHVENHKEWLSVVANSVRPLGGKFHGFALTGWQRYDHYSVLCELLPVGVPSLAVCLLTFTAGAFTREVHKMASDDLGFNELVSLSPLKSMENETMARCNFPGHEIYSGVHTLLRLKAEYKFFIKNDRLKGWMTPWHVRNNFTNPVHLSHFLPHAQRLLESFNQLKLMFEAELGKIFYADTVAEWLSVNIEPVVNKLDAVIKTTNKQIELGGSIRNPSPAVTGATENESMET